MAFLYPWGNTQQLNLDWIIQKIKELDNSPPGSAEIAGIANALLALTYDSGTAYNVGDIVYRNEKLYSCNTAIVSPGEAWNPAHWDEVLLGDAVANLLNMYAALDSDAVGNASDVTGSNVTAALNTLKTNVQYANELVTVIESGTTATRNYPIGSLVIINGRLWETTAAISIGDPFSQNTNIKRTTVATELKQKPILLIFGDSWSAPNGQYSWATDFATNHPQLDIKNFARGGAKLAGGDIPGDNGTIGGQIVTALADTSFLPTDVKYILIMGGSNDYRNMNPANATNAAPIAAETKTNIDRLKAAYSNAVIITCINYAIGVPEEEMRFCNYLVNHIARNTGTSAYNMIGWINPAYFESDRIHTNSAGQAQIAANIEKLIFGGDIKYVNTYHQEALTFPDGENYTGLVTIEEFFTNYGVVIKINAKVTQAIADITKATCSLSLSDITSDLGYTPFVYVPLTKGQLSKAQLPSVAFFSSNYSNIADHNNESVDMNVTIIFQADATANRTAIGEWMQYNTW